MTPEERVTAVQTRVLLEAWHDASARTWLRRAEQLEAARPRRGDYTGRATPADLTARWDRLTASAAACRARATGLDGVAAGHLVDTLHDVASEAAA